ncbi:MAG TPA: hypothetical protein VNE59_04735 [Burkholderiales bacterium]|nr:hypothetical protein [Burkholderiales bacterium]
MRWRKLGRVFCPEAVNPWMRSHAANPVAEVLDERICRVYFSTRDERNCASIAWLELDLREPTKVLHVGAEPVLSPGRVGAFDDSGASMGCLVRTGDKRYLYYLGWNLGVTVPWRNSIGLAVSHDGGPFERVSEAPVLDRGHYDPFSVSYPWVLVEGGRWRMWYGSNLDWGLEQTDMAHLIKYAESDDGVAWRREGRIAIAFRSPDEYAMSKPCVLKDGARFRMWYSYRGNAYRIGYADSEDGLSWRRLDERAGIGVSDEGWDSEAVCYPCVFDCAGRRYMLYNGNRYGLTGFGIAVLEDDPA